MQKLNQSTDVLQPSLIENYTKRPKALKSICLAENVTSYHNARQKQSEHRVNNRLLGNIDTPCNDDGAGRDDESLIEAPEEGIRKTAKVPKS